MKYYILKIGTIALLLIVLTGCAGQPYTQKTEDKTTTQEDVFEDKENEESVSQPERSPLVQKLVDLVVNDADSVMVAAYVRENITEVLPEEADDMIEILLQMQTQLIQKSHAGILYEPKYLEALNSTMGGILDPNKVANIKDDAVRTFYQSVVDSDLTMVKYEETPVLETDWEKIARYQATFTDAFQMVVDFHYYNDLIRNENVDVLVSRIYAMEDMLQKTPYGFAKFELTDLYNTYVSRLLAGPEGAYLYRLTDAKDSYTKKMAIATEDHETSGFARVARTMMKEETNTFNHLISIVDGYRLSNPYGKHHWEELIQKDDKNEVIMLVYSSEDTTVTQRVNDILKAAADDFIKTMGIRENYSLDMYKTYQYGDSATIHLYMNYDTEDGKTYYEDKVINLDMKHGTLLTLNALMKTSDAKLLDEINTLSESDFTVVPDFSLTLTGLLLTGEREASSSMKVATITKDELLKIKLR